MKFRIDKTNEKLVLIEGTVLERNQLQIHLTRHVKGYVFQKRYKLGLWDGTITHYRSNGINIGLWKEVLTCCQINNFGFHIENKEDFPVNKNLPFEEIEDFCHDFYKQHKLPFEEYPEGIPFMPYDHQQETIHKILKYRYCGVEIATGGGKSLVFGTLLFYILKRLNPSARFLLIVPSITLVKQFYDDLNDYNNGFNNENADPCDLRMTEIMSSKPRKVENPNVVIGTYQSLEKYPDDFFRDFGYVSCDEAHTAKAKTVISVLTKTMKDFRASIRFGMTGTFPESTSAEYLTIQSVTGPKITEVGAIELTKKGILTPMKIKALILNHQDDEFRSSLAMIKSSGRGREVLNIEKQYAQKSKRRMDFIINRILQNTKDNTLVLFFNIEYGREIYDHCKSRLIDKDTFYIDGGVNGEKRSYIKEEMKATDRPKILVASYGTLSTGVSIKSITNIIMCDSFKSEQIIIQSIGRSLRLHKEKTRATIFDIVDVFDDNYKTVPNYLYKHYLERKKFYERREYPYESKTIIL